MHWRRKLLKVRGATLLNWSDFLLQKLQSYGEASNLRGPWLPGSPIPPPMYLLCSIQSVKPIFILHNYVCNRKGALGIMKTVIENLLNSCKKSSIVTAHIYAKDAVSIGIILSFIWKIVKMIDVHCGK